MLLTIDIGNSTTKFGIFEGRDLAHKFAIPTKRDYTPDELFFDRFRFLDERLIRIDTVIVSSVVPELDERVRQVCKEHFNVTPVFVDHTFDFGLKIKYDPPSDAGADRLINASAAVTKYGKPVIVCSFGTATVIDAVNADGEYLGGIIAPGMAAMAEALHLKTSKLPRVDIKKPKKVIGNSTVTSIQSGVFYGYLGLVEGLIARFLEVQSPKSNAPSLKSADFGHGALDLGHPKIIATGGFASLIAPECKSIDIVDENLTLDGLRLLGAKRSQKPDG